MEVLASEMDESSINTIKSKLPKEVHEKLTSVLDCKFQELSSIKLKLEKLRVNSEQQYFDLEKQLITTNGKLEIESSQKFDLQNKYDELEKRHVETTKKNEDLQISKDGFQSKEYEYKSKVQTLENDKRDLSIQNTKKGKEIERLNEEIKELNKKSVTANNEKCEAQAKFSELQSEQVSREYREKRLEKEKEQLETQIQWFDGQLTEKTNQLSMVRKEKTNHLLEIQASLEEKTQELEHVQALVDSLKESAEEQNKKIESLNEKLRDERDSQVQLDEQWRQELNTQKRLTDLYKVSAEENDGKISELTGAVEELRRLLKEAAEAYTELESGKAEEVKSLTVAVKEKGESVSKLEQELKNANELMVALKKGAITLTEDAVEAQFPRAAETSRLLKTGMSLTQIYNEYVQATDLLSAEKEENRRLQSYLDQIVQEIEEKAPILKKQREDYETALLNLEQITTQLDSTMLECEKLRTDADDMRRRFGHVQREYNKEQQTAQDLSKQVQLLLKEIEELKGGRVVRDDLNVSSTTEVSSSSSIISEKLVTFRNIQELQQQNQKLIEVARSLGEKKEAEEREATEEKTRDLKEQLEFAMSELNCLKEARSRQAELVESIVRQRDMYRVLLQQGGKSPEMPSHAPVTSTPMITQAKSPVRSQPSADMIHKRELEAAQNAMRELQGEFQVYKKDKADNEKILNETIDKARKNASDLRVANTKLSTQLDFATERYKILQNNVAGFKKEIDLLQDRNQQSSSLILRHETAVANLKEELTGAQENVARWQVQVETLKNERELLKNSERRLVMELESMRREQTSQTMLMTSLQAIKNNQEKAEFEARSRHNNQVDGLEKEIAHLRRRLENSLEEKAKQATSWEDIVKNTHLELSHEKEKVLSWKTKSENVSTELQTVTQNLKSCEAKLEAAEKKLENLSSRNENEDTSTTLESRIETEAVKDLKNQMAQQAMQIKNLQQKLEESKKQISQYQTIANGVEMSLKEQSSASKEVQSACERKISDALSEKDTMSKRLEMVEKDLEAANAENVRLTNESQTLHGDLRKQLVKVQTELEEAINQRDTAVANKEAAQKDLKEQADIASKAQDKYQRELLLHSADVEALQAVKKQMEESNEFLQQSQEETATYEKQLSDAKTSWSEQERICKDEVKMLETRCEELNKQNTVLHEQMSKLSSQVESIQETSRRESFGSYEETGKTSEQLLEVVKFLRREKEIAETKQKAVETECNRVKQRFSHLEKMAEESKKALSEERQRSQTNAETVANQMELMRKVSSLNVLTDSNKLLRDERDQLLNSKQETEAKLSKLELDIEPLQNKLREVESLKETLTLERDTLQEEVNRWKNRTSHLIDQSHKTDPEEHKRVLQEKENLRRQLIQMKEEQVKQKTEVMRVTSANTILQTEINNVKQQATKTSEELTTVKKRAEEKSKESEDKTMTINRLKQIGRKYKEQAEKVSKELEDIKVKAAGQETNKVNVASLEQTIGELRRTITSNSSTISSLENQLTESQKECQAQVKRAEQSVGEANTLKETISKQQQLLTKTLETNNKLIAEVGDFETRASDFEKKQAQSKQVLQTARNKMVSQKAEMEKLDSENTRLKAALAAVQGGSDSSEVIAQYESRLARIESELEEARKTAAMVQNTQVQVERYQGENSELQAKIQQLQRQLEAAQHKHSPPQQPLAARSSSSMGPSTSGEPPKTANIKPMATAVASSRQSAPITSHSQATVRATASIRPMAISPATTSPPSTGTPTATVMPTTATQHEPITADDNLPGPSGLQQTSSIPATSSRVQIVEPQVAGDWNQDTIESPEETSTNQAVVSPSVMVTPVSANLPSTSDSAQPHSAQPHTSQPHAGAQPHTTGKALGKRVRDDESFLADESDSKRTRIGSQQEHACIPTINVIDENQQVVTQIQPQTSRPTGAATPVTSDTAWDSTKETDAEQGQAGGDVIMVLSDEDDQQNEEDQNEEEDEDDEDYEDEDEDEEEDEAEDPDDVVIIDMDAEQDEPASVELQSAEPIAPVGRSQPLTAPPFILPGSSNPFEDDDCTVPSTPTLAQPRRADGFAEALNSPAVAQRFVFGSGMEGSNNPDLAQLESQRALGMDDTRMDLSQFDESGRSAPTTPIALITTTVSTDQSASNKDSEDGIAGQSTSEQTQDNQRREKLEREEDEELEGDLEGDQGDEEDIADEDSDIRQEGPSGVSKDDESSQDSRSETAAKPQIKKIVWDHSEAAGSSASSAPVVSPAIKPLLDTPPPTKAQTAQRGLRRAQGMRRGGPSRGRGSAQVWAQQSPGASRGGGLERVSRGANQRASRGESLGASRGGMGFGQRARGWRGSRGQ